MSPFLQPFTLYIKDKEISNDYHKGAYTRVRKVNWFFFLVHVIWLTYKLARPGVEYSGGLFVQIAFFIVCIIIHPLSYRFNQALWLLGPLLFGMHCTE